MQPFEFIYSEYDYPEDLAQIMEYLIENGAVYATPKEIEKLYRQYSSEEWCAGWMSVAEYILPSFAQWLSKQDI